MKARILAFLLFLVSGTASAQHDFFQYGVQLGPSWVNMYGNPFIETFLKSDFRFTGGPTIYYPFARKWAIRTNLFFESKGAEGIMPLYDRTGMPLGIFTVKSKLNYLTVPLLLDLHFGEKFRFDVNMGPFIGLLIGHKTVYKEPVTGEAIIDKGTSSFIPWDGGLVLGSGFRYGINRRITLSLDGRFNIGMTNIVSRPIFSSLTIYTLSSQVLLGVYYTPGYNAGKVRNIKN